MKKQKIYTDLSDSEAEQDEEVAERRKLIRRKKITAPLCLQNDESDSISPASTEVEHSEDSQDEWDPSKDD